MRYPTPHPILKNALSRRYIDSLLATMDDFEVVHAAPLLRH
jgi:hypothetical protein